MQSDKFKAEDLLNQVHYTSFDDELYFLVKGAFSLFKKGIKNADGQPVFREETF